MNPYLPIFTMGVLAALFAGLSFFASRLLAPRKPTAAKSAPYECGIVPTREPAERFTVRFYLVAMIFIIFDIEVMFLFPWVVIHRDLALYGLVAMVVFTVPVLVAFLYELSNGALDWGPIKRARPEEPAAVVRTAATTVRRIPRDFAAPERRDPEEVVT
jgi:NADH-quinone oxidoreductase subunit A